jgi:hypothetical protein
VFDPGSPKGGDIITLLGQGFGGNLSAGRDLPVPASYATLGYSSFVQVGLWRSGGDKEEVCLQLMQC